MNFIFNINRAREHLKNCISAGEVKQFPLLDMYQRVMDNSNRNKNDNETEIVDNENSQRVNKPTSHGSTHMSNAAIERNMEKKNTKTKCASDLRTDQDNTKTLLKNYFQDQKQKTTMKRKHSPDQTMEIDGDKYLDKTVKAKFKDKQRKRIKLKNMTEEEKKSSTLSKKEQMKRLRQNTDYKFQESKRKKEKNLLKSVEEKEERIPCDQFVNL